MSGTGASVSPNAISSSVVEITARPSRTGAPLFVKISTNGGSGCGLAANCSNCDPPTSSKGPSCVFVGPLETANKETLEALYLQARDAYYSGAPIIVDDMFDRVELILRWYGSKSVVKYPRCSLRRQSTYADAEADSSQVFALASIWILILAFGSSACLAPIIYTVTLTFQDAFSQGVLYYNQSFAFEFLSMVSAILFMALGSSIGYPIASASVKVLQGLWRNDLVALKGPCPNCGEQVFAFVQPDQFKNTSHRANCHVCECYLEFRTTVEQSISSLGRNWVHGRIYLVSQGGRSRHQRFM